MEFIDLVFCDLNHFNIDSDTAEKILNLLLLNTNLRFIFIFL